MSQHYGNKITRATLGEENQSGCLICVRTITHSRVKSIFSHKCLSIPLNTDNVHCISLSFDFVWCSTEIYCFLMSALWFCLFNVSFIFFCLSDIRFAFLVYLMCILLSLSWHPILISQNQWISKYEKNPWIWSCNVLCYVQSFSLEQYIPHNIFTIQNLTDNPYDKKINTDKSTKTS